MYNVLPNGQAPAHYVGKAPGKPVSVSQVTHAT
jgi:hypothetical protein